MKAQGAPIEFGSFFDSYLFWQAMGVGDGRELGIDRASLFATARGALTGILLSLPSAAKRLWVPSYYCHDAYRVAVRRTGIQVAAYPAGPLEDAHVPWGEVGEGDAVVICNTFGLTEPVRLAHARGWIIEDHTHDPWSDWALNSSADFRLASLRKVLPMPDGAVVTSPTSGPVVQPTHHDGSAEELSRQMFDLMERKAARLGRGLSASEYYPSYVAIERQWDDAGSEPISLRSRAWLAAGPPVYEWRQRRRQIYRVIAERLPDGVTQRLGAGAAPSCVPVVLPTDADAHRFREFLIADAVYPPSNWAVDIHAMHGPHGVSGQPIRKTAGRLVQVPCDPRYSAFADELAARVVAAYRRAVDGFC